MTERQEGHAGLWSTRTYDRLAPHYDRWFRLVFPAGVRAWHLLVRGLRPGRLLDVGCGTGTLLELARAAGMECCGVDLSAGMLARARARLPEAVLKRASFYAIPWPDGFFDYVVESCAVSARGVDQRSVVNEMLRVCRPGGEVRIGDFCRAPRRTPLTWLVEQAGELIGDHCTDYRAIFRDFGYATEETALGMLGLYRLVRVQKRRAGPAADGDASVPAPPHP